MYRIRLNGILDFLRSESHLGYSVRRTQGTELEFVVGFKLRDELGHVIRDAEDALIAALKVKIEHPAALITYVRRRNKRGDARHTPADRTARIVEEASP
jgi:hypothetical protein